MLYCVLLKPMAFGRAVLWAEWVAFLSGFLLLPWEVRELFRGVSVLRSALLLGNLAVVFYMLHVILTNRRERQLHLQHGDAKSRARSGN